MGAANWLEAEVITCPGCGLGLFTVFHSPHLDDHRLYCDCCPNAIEISYYDPAYARAVPPSGEYNRDQIMAAVEPLLRLCECGGRFRDNAPSRCFHCRAEVPAAAHKDLYPYIGCEGEERDPTPKELAEYRRFDAEFIRREGFWANGPDGVA